MTATAAPTKCRPILFSGPMVRALLRENNPKSQTRRVIVPQPDQKGTLGSPFAETYAWYWECPRLDVGYCHTNEDAMARLMVEVCPFGQRGDRLRVRETWGLVDTSGRTLTGEADLIWSDRKTARFGKRPRVIYKADGHSCDMWRPSIHMPMWASRITLEITEIRVERLRSISESDAQAEGATYFENDDYDPEDPSEDPEYSYVAGFADLWDEINGERDGGIYAWNRDPFVWAISFRRMEE